MDARHILLVGVQIFVFFASAPSFAKINLKKDYVMHLSVYYSVILFRKKWLAGITAGYATFYSVSGLYGH